MYKSRRQPGAVRGKTILTAKAQDLMRRIRPDEQALIVCERAGRMQRQHEQEQGQKWAAGIINSARGSSGFSCHGASSLTNS